MKREEEVAMKRSIAAVAILLLGLSSLPVVFGDGKPVDAETFRAFRVFYDYDKQLPLEVKISSDQAVRATEHAPAYRLVALSFMNNRDERIPAMLWIPAEGKGPFPCTFFLHGLGGNKSNAGAFATELLKQGYATMSLDAAYHGERAAGKPGMYGTTF